MTYLVKFISFALFFSFSYLPAMNSNNEDGFGEFQLGGSYEEAKPNKKQKKKKSSKKKNKKDNKNKSKSKSSSQTEDSDDDAPDVDDYDSSPSKSTESIKDESSSSSSKSSQSSSESEESEEDQNQETSIISPTETNYNSDYQSSNYNYDSYSQKEEPKFNDPKVDSKISIAKNNNIVRFFDNSKEYKLPQSAQDIIELVAQKIVQGERLNKKEAVKLNKERDTLTQWR